MDYDWDIYEVFKEQLDRQLPHIEYNILVLEQKDLVSDSIDELFNRSIILRELSVLYFLNRKFDS